MQLPATPIELPRSMKAIIGENRAYDLHEFLVSFLLVIIPDREGLWRVSYNRVSSDRMLTRSFSSE